MQILQLSGPNAEVDDLRKDLAPDNRDEEFDNLATAILLAREQEKAIATLRISTYEVFCQFYGDKEWWNFSVLSSDLQCSIEQITGQVVFLDRLIVKEEFRGNKNICKKMFDVANSLVPEGIWLTGRLEEKKGSERLYNRLGWTVYSKREVWQGTKILLLMYRLSPLA